MFSGLLAFCLVCSHTLLGNFQTLHLSPARHPGWGVGWGGRSTLPGSDGCKVEEAGARRTQEPHTLSQSPLPAPCIWSWAVSALFAASKWLSGGGGLSGAQLHDTLASVTADHQRRALGQGVLPLCAFIPSSYNEGNKFTGFVGSL